MPFYPPNLEEFLQEYIPENFGSDFIFNKLKLSLKDQFSKEDEEKFENNWTLYHGRVFKTAVLALVRNVILKIAERHPWLILSSKDFHNYFLEIDIFLKIFIENLICKAVKDYWNVDYRQLLQTESLDLIDNGSNWLEDEIQIGPFDPIPKLLIHRPSPIFSLANVGKLTLDYRLSHVDILHFLYNVYVKDQKSQQVFSKTAVINQDGFHYLTDQQKTEVALLFVNIGDLSQLGITEWILIEKTNQTSGTVYYPHFLEESAIKEKLQQAKLDLTYQSIDCSTLKNCLAQDNYAIWHIVLLLKVLPFTFTVQRRFEKENQISDEKEEKSHREKEPYLEKIPFFILLQSVFDQIQRYSVNKHDPIFLPGGRSAPIGEAERIIQLFKEGKLVIEDDCHTICLNFGNSQEYINIYPYLLIVIDHGHGQLYRLKYSLSASLYEEDASFSKKIKSLFESGIYLSEIELIGEPPGNKLYENAHQYAVTCVARNQFMWRQDKQHMQSASASTVLKKKLWEDTGRAIAFFFIQHGEKLSSDAALHTIIQYYQSPSQQPNTLPDYIQDFLQITKMGQKGFESFFHYLATEYVTDWEQGHAEPLPLLSCVFDLERMGKKSPEFMINSMKEYINKQEESFPLFHSFSIILSSQAYDFSSLSPQTELISLITENEKILEERGCVKIVNPEFDQDIFSCFVSQNQCDALINKTYRVLNFLHFGKIDTKFYSQRAQYRTLQNVVQRNQKERRYPLLQDYTTFLYEEREEKSGQEWDVYCVEMQQQPWEGNNSTYSLHRQIFSIEQQQEQEQQAEADFHDQSRQKKTQRSTQKQDDFSSYEKEESLLITRDNIEEKADIREIWNSVPIEVKRLIGQDNVEKPLRRLFSIWVGSDKDIGYLITKMEPAAVKRILKDVAQFRMGIVKCHLPPGFKLAYSEEGHLILCFSVRQEREDLKPDSLWRKQKSPFTVILPREKPREFQYGDFREFFPLTTHEAEEDKKQVQKTYWHYLVTTENDSHVSDKEEFYSYLTQKKYEPRESIADEHLAVMMQHVDIAYELEESKARWRRIEAEGLNNEALPYMRDFMETPEVSPAIICKPVLNFNECLAHLKGWSRKNVSAGFLDYFFSTEEKKGASLTLQNLKSFGQLFNHYDREDESSIKGTISFLKMADRLYLAFGPEYFSVWKIGVLDISQNWVELLEKEEVDAVVESVAILKNSEIFKEQWWALAKRHYDTTNHVYYSELWSAFRELLDVIKEKKLVLKQTEWKKVLERNDFHAVVFLDRLCTVLKNLSQPQSILDHLSEIDWRESGFYHASNQGHRHWDPELKLEEFYSNPDAGSHVIAWPVEFQPQDRDITTHALRFANIRICLSYQAFIHFKNLMKASQMDVHFGRFFTAYVALGIDPVEGITSAQIENVKQRLDSSFIAWVNKNIALEGELIPKTVLLHFDDLVILSKILEELELMGAINSYTSSEALLFMNSCARALQYYKKHTKQSVEIKLKELLEYNKNFDFLMQPLLTDFPWLIDDFYGYPHKNFATDFSIEELQILRRQLRSIDVEQSTYFPSYGELKNIWDILINVEKKEEKDEKKALDLKQIREKFIKNLIEKGCVVVYQAVNFRLLSTHEKQKASNLIDTSYQNQSVYSEQNSILLKKLIDSHLAIEEKEESPELCIEKLIDLFIYLDNKPYYNELGQALGLLLKYADKQPPAYYSVAQLFDVLTLLCEKDIANRHYPVVLLEEILIAEGISGLLHSDLKELTSITCPIIERSKQFIQEIIRSDQQFPDQYKFILLKIMLQDPIDEAHVSQVRQSIFYLDQQGVRPKWLKLLSEFAISKDNEKRQHFKALAELPKILQGKNILNDLWQKCQIKCLQFLSKETLSNQQKKNITTLLSLKEAEDEKECYIRMILIAAGALDVEEFEDIENTLKSKNVDELKSLASYFASGHKIPISSLRKLLPVHPTVKALIHYFECVSQRFDEKGEDKQDYSLEEKEVEELVRVLVGLKRKGIGIISNEVKKRLANLLFYANNYSQVEQLSILEIDELQGRLLSHTKNLGECKEDSEKNYAAARLLACIRAVILKKSGKWPHSTQMFDLLYVAMHNEENLLHQIRTGQGKSIVSVMRAAYLALNGFVVNLFSKKESLSERDHEEFQPVLDAIKIPNVYITPDSPIEDYHREVDHDGVGAIHYATVGGMSLFRLSHQWRKGVSFGSRKKHVAFLDECDDVLKEPTRFNFAASNESSYNMDAWVYEITYAYYIEKIKDLSEIQRDPHLKDLCALLQENVKKSPVRSSFLKKYIFPALKKKSAVNARDQKLLELLRAAHDAFTMKEGKAFCVRPKREKVRGNFLKTQAANVLLANEIKKGAIYSYLVQQFLHVRLNREASNQGKLPNYFIPPVSEIALSMTAEYHFNNDYQKIEGCSSTMGTDADFQYYQERYGISHVIKLPTHEQIKMKKERTIYCENKEEQITALKTRIEQSIHNQPILITCEDDAAVKEIASYLMNAFVGSEYEAEKNIIVDTNDSGKKENEVVLMSGAIGKVTISARMGRGTDIKPLSEEGLLVLRTFPSTPDVVKQDHGRAGRNGAKGTCLDIIDYSVVEKEYFFYQEGNYKSRLEKIIELETEHLNTKIKKHSKRGSTDFDHLKNGKLDREKYLITRSVERLKDEIKKQNQLYARKKDYLISTLSQIITGLLNVHQAHEDISQFKRNWINFIQDLDNAWGQACLEKEDQMYANFLAKAQLLWGNFRSSYNNTLFIIPAFPESLSQVSFPRFSFLSDQPQALDNQKDDLISVEEGATEKESEEEKEEQEEEDKKDSLLSFPIIIYQKLIKGAQKYYFNEEKEVPAQLKDALYGEKSKDIEGLFSTLMYQSVIVFKKLANLLSEDCLCHFSYGSIKRYIETISDNIDDKFDMFFNQLCFQKSPEKSVIAIQKNSFLLDFFIDFFKKFKFQAGEIKCFIENVTQAVHDPIISWNAENAKKIMDLFLNHENITDFLIKSNNKDIIAHIIHQCCSGQKGDVADKLEIYLNKNEEVLKKLPEVREPLLKLAFMQTEDNFFLPDVNQLNHMPERLQDLLWNFLYEHAPLEEKVYEKFFDLFLKTELNDEGQSFLAGLLRLPPCIRLEYIHQKISALIPENKGILGNLTLSANAFYRYLLHTKKVKIGFPLEPSQDTTKLIQLFENMSEAKSHLFFENLHEFNHLDIGTVEEIGFIFNKGEIGAQLLRESLAILNEIILKEEKNPQLNTLKNYYLKHLPLSHDFNRKINSILQKVNRFDELQPEGYLSEYFSDFDRNKESRQLIASYFIHGLLNPENKEEWLKGYKKFALDFTQLPPGFEKDDSKKRSYTSREQYKKLLQMMQEVEKISHHPLEEPSKPKEEFKGDDDWDSYIDTQKTYYANQWFVNWTRRKQAEDLFINLKKERSFFGKLEVIISTQRNILESDQKAGCRKKNKKGYSRLLDITVSMFITFVSNEFIQHFESFSLEDKNQLNTLLKDQCRFILEILKDELPLKSPLKNIEFSSGSYEEFLGKLNNHRNSVPKHLHYLLDQFVCFAPLFEHFNHDKPDVRVSI